jgi:hypothetical protein
MVGALHFPGRHRGFLPADRIGVGQRAERQAGDVLDVPYRNLVGAVGAVRECFRGDLQSLDQLFLAE